MTERLAGMSPLEKSAKSRTGTPAEAERSTLRELASATV